MLYLEKETNLRYATSLCGEGIFLEFGVSTGYSINYLADFCPTRKIYGFDSFEGLPQPWYNHSKGAFKTAGPPQVRENVELIIGMFEDTIPPFIASHPERIALVHIDCDLYESTKCVFDNLEDRLLPGTMLVFDEYHRYNGYEQHEYKAFKEFIERTKRPFEFMAMSNAEQVSVILL